ncbi:Baculoviral inhibition of apoptosis protein repeat domain-containing protein [Strongyloides ratti]|uniref:Baculoviral inhibition of apoptosis protein repeat domain-containing protein n=1 Tax=Strongyloides ratti TaxID=34506 RepID=A0A090LA70_STRRB|nr:Baculoviral inhibition of apoptosis protein repeat domain-containing protein [Strongyloides ratti]CEF65038.1 Baculoviral inhibition of apoptosis protein repeat domain-containing protein [Strongyloides ratti]
MIRKSFSPLAYLDSFNDPEITSLLLTVNRLKTFKEWPFDNISSAKCTSIELAIAGFYMTSNEENAPLAKCICCLKELTWEEDDIPLHEHLRKMPHCRLAEIISEKKEKDMTIRDILSILTMRDITIIVNSQIDEDISIINSAMKYNDDFVVRTLKNF